jgi:hypothetical protein
MQLPLLEVLEVLLESQIGVLPEQAIAIQTLVVEFRIGLAVGQMETHLDVEGSQFGADIFAHKLLHVKVRLSCISKNALS